MSINEIPIRVVGPGSQPGAENDSPAYIDMPRDMSRYSAPQMPDADAVEHLLAARETMTWLKSALMEYRESGDNACANLNALDDENRQLINQILGEGENAVTYKGSLNASGQESVLAGVWRSLYYDDDDEIAIDLLEVGAVPLLVSAPVEDGRPVDTSTSDTDVPNALPLLVELAEHSAAYARSGVPHSINLTLLPLSIEELEFLDARLGRGPVDILSRAYGKCQVISTLSPNVWWVRYYNSMGTLILNSLEVCSVPDVVAAAPEDIEDSASRLLEILAPYWPDAT